MPFAELFTSHAKHFLFRRTDMSLVTGKQTIRRYRHRSWLLFFLYINTYTILEATKKRKKNIT